MVENDRHRAVVDERDVHARAEATALDLDALAFQRLAEALVEGFRDLGCGGGGEARPVALGRIENERDLSPLGWTSCPTSR